MEKFRRIMATVFSITAILGFIGMAGINLDYPRWGWWLVGAIAVFVGSLLLIFVCEDPERAAEMFRTVILTAAYIIYLAISWFGHNIWRFCRRITRACIAFGLDPERNVRYTYKDGRHYRR